MPRRTGTKTVQKKPIDYSVVPSRVEIAKAIIDTLRRRDKMDSPDHTTEEERAYNAALAAIRMFVTEEQDYGGPVPPPKGAPHRGGVRRHRS